MGLPKLDQLLSLRLSKPFFENVLLENGGLYNALPSVTAIQLDFCSEQVEGGILSHTLTL